MENVSDTAARDAYESVYAAYGAVRSGSTDSLTGKYSTKYFNAVITALSEGDCDITTGTTNMKWSDTRRIAEELVDRYPDTDPLLDRGTVQIQWR